MDDDDVADATGGSASTRTPWSRWRIPEALQRPIYERLKNELPRSIKGKLTPRPGSVTTDAVPHAPFQKLDAFRLEPLDPITRAEVTPHKNPSGDSREDFLATWTQHPCVVWVPHVQMSRVLSRMPCPLGGFECVTGPAGMNHWGPRLVHGKPSYFLWTSRYECKNEECSIKTFLGYDYRVLRFLSPSVISLFPALVTKRCALDIHLLDEMRRTSVASLKFAEHARGINEYNRLHHLRRETLYYDYMADRRRPMPGAPTPPPFALSWPVFPFPQIDSDEWIAGQVSANYLANCYVADHACREQWQETRQATITGRFGRFDHTFAVAKKIRVDGRALHSSTSQLTLSRF